MARQRSRRSAGGDSDDVPHDGEQDAEGDARGDDERGGPTDGSGGSARDASDGGPADALATDRGDNDPKASDGTPQAEGDARMAELEAQVEDLRGRLARALADYQNLQRRVERDATLERERVKARFLEDFLQVYEYGQMAAFEAERNPGPLADGVKMVVREFDRLLEKEGVEKLGTLGEPFDRDVHEAVATEAAADIGPGHVSRVVAPGYRLGERILRFAKVAVAPGETEEEE